MNKSRKLSLINMFVNLAIIALEVTGAYFITDGFTAFSADKLKYYTLLTAAVTLLAAALMIWANIVSYIKRKDCTPRLFYSLRFLSAVMSLLTFVTVAAFLVPKDGTALLFDTRSGNLFFHLLCPLISIIQFIGFEIEPKAKFKKTFEPFIATFIYGIAILITMFVIQFQQGVDAAKDFVPYFFFKVTPELGGEDYLINIAVLVGVVVISYVASLIVWLLNRMFHAIFIGEEYQPITANKPEPKKSFTVSGSAFKNYMKNKVSFGDGTAPSGGQVYHISYHDRRLKTWKVKTENAGRALKVFPTQKEAIDFANEQVKKNGGSIRVHSMVGKIRKE